MLNSFVVAVIVTVAQVVTSVLVGVRLRDARVPGPQRRCSSLFLATMLVPLEATLVVNRRTVDSLGWLNTYQGLTVPFLATAFGTFLIRQVFLTLPRDLRDAAAIDGVGHLGFLRHVAVPLVRPTIGALAALAFLSTWNQYLWPNLITTEADMYTLQSGLRFAQPGPASTSPNLVMAGVHHRLPADRHRAARLPAPARARPHRRAGSRDEPARPASSLVRGVRRSLAACASGESILAGRQRPAAADDDDDDRPAGDGGARRDAAADDDRPPVATTTTTPLASLPPCPVDALDDVTGAGRDHVLARPGGRDRDGARSTLTDAYNASQTEVRVRAREPGRLQGDASTSTCRAARTAGPTW